MSTEKRIIITTTCDRPRCGTVISELEELPEGTDEKPPALVIKRAGKPDIVYQDLCGRCSDTINNYCDRVEKKPVEKKVEPAVEPVDPSTPRWDEGSGEWATGEGDDRRAYSHKPGEELTIVIPALEGVTDPAAAGALIAAYEEE